MTRPSCIVDWRASRTVSEPRWSISNTGSDSRHWLDGKGLSFTAAGSRAREAHKRANMRTPYWDWSFRDGEAHYHKYCGTPPEHLLFGLRAALDMIFAEGL